jgi:dUTP pyrophosphatase
VAACQNQLSRAPDRPAGDGAELSYVVVPASDVTRPATSVAGWNDVDVLVTRLHPAAVLPAYALPGDAGADLCSTVDVTLSPGERALVPTGVAIALPYGYAAFIHPRSGLAARTGLSIVNAPGTVDAGYRGEVGVLLVNTDLNTDVVLHSGDRIAQLVVQRVEHATFVEVRDLPGSARSAAGFGSTGGFTATSTAPTSTTATGTTETGTTAASTTEHGRR